jgi:hypothetical protein
MSRAVAPDSGRLPSSTLRGAKKRLMETHPNSTFEPTNWDHNHLKFLIATALPFFTIDKPDSNRQLETIRNGRNPFNNMQMTFSNRPKISARWVRPSETGRSGIPRQVKGSRRDASATLGERQDAGFQSALLPIRNQYISYKTKDRGTF